MRRANRRIIPNQVLMTKNGRPYTLFEQNLHIWRTQYRDFEEYEWTTDEDAEDIHDLRYLFDQVEPIEIKSYMMEFGEYDGRPFYYHIFNEEEIAVFEALYRVANFKELAFADEEPAMLAAVPAYDSDGELIDGNWEREVHEWRFVYRLGWINDEYDSGVDEILPKKERYPPLDEEGLEDPDEQSMLEHLQRLLDERVGAKIREREEHPQKPRKKRQRHVKA